MMQVSVPIYQSELSPAKQRGLMVGGHGILIVSGYAMAAWTGLGCFFAGTTVQWRLCLSLQLVAPLLLLIGSPWLPESPRWLIAHNKEQEGLAILQKLHVRADDKGDTDHIAAKEEFYQIRKQLELERETGVQTFLEMIKRPSYRKRIYCGVLVQFAAQSTGVLVVNNYQILLYNSLGLHGWLPLLLYGVYTSWAAFLNWINALLLDRVGRKPVIIIGLSGCICMICIYTAMVAEYAGTSNRAGNAMGVLFLFLFVTFYGSSVSFSSIQEQLKPLLIEPTLSSKTRVPMSSALRSSQQPSEHRGSVRPFSVSLLRKCRLYLSCKRLLTWVPSERCSTPKWLP